jgi:hypothetical protein
MTTAKKARHLTWLAGLLVLVGLLAPMNGSTASSDKVWMPVEGVVPDVITAEKIAEVIFARFYGAEEIAREKPFSTSIRDDVWIVKGSLPQGMLGGLAEIHVRKKDGQVLHLFHGR